jgi:hypothetical protein
MTVRMIMLFFWVLVSCRLIYGTVYANILEKHIVSIFRAEMVMLESGGIYTGLEGGTTQGVGLALIPGCLTPWAFPPSNPI